MKLHEKRSIIKFMLIYLSTSFMLLSIIAVLYFFEAKHQIVKELEYNMIDYISNARFDELNTDNDLYKLEIADAKDHAYPKFLENKNSFSAIACASKFYPTKVFILKADKNIIAQKINNLYIKILLIYLALFFPFFIVSYYLAKISIKPVKDSYKFLDMFLEDIIHDIKTPITSINMNLKILQSEDKKTVKRIEIATETLKLLYDNLEEMFHNIEKGKAVDINLNDFVRERVQYYLAISPNSNFTLDLKNKIIHMDRLSLIRIIDNIVLNAIKYSGKNPKVIIRMQEDKLYIQDSGLGIGDTLAIFNRNYREEEYIDGLGLGLNIVMKLVHELNLELKVESEKGEGSCFIINFCNVIK